MFSTPLALRAHFEADAGLQGLLRHVERHLDADAAHDVGHCLRVAEWSVRLAGDAVSPRLCIAAALLHDIINLPKNHPDRAEASTLSAARAREVLRDFAFDDADIDLVADAIRDHSFTRGAIPQSALGKALQDADRLEALGVIGTFRCIATGVRLGADFFDAFDPWATSRTLDDKRFSIDHFFTKLLTLPATFHTHAGRLEAERRAGVMRVLLEALGDEIGQPVARA